MSIKNSLFKFLTRIKNEKKYFSKILKKRKGIKFDKENFYSWMKLTKKERFNLSNRDSMTYFLERKNLLNQIRDEYKNTIENN